MFTDLTFKLSNINYILHLIFYKNVKIVDSFI